MICIVNVAHSFNIENQHWTESQEAEFAMESALSFHWKKTNTGVIQQPYIHKIVCDEQETAGRQAGNSFQAVGSPEDATHSTLGGDDRSERIASEHCT